MKYFETYENVTKEYDVVIDEKKAEEIIKKLDEEFSTIVTRTSMVSSNTMEEAMQKINAANVSDIKVLNVYEANELGDEYSFLNNFSKSQNVYECEYTYRQVPYLSHLLKIILNNYHTDNDVTSTMNEIKDYENSLDLNMYREKLDKGELTEDEYRKYGRFTAIYLDILGLFSGFLIRDTINYDNSKNDKPKRLFK